MKNIEMLPRLRVGVVLVAIVLFMLGTPDSVQAAPGDLDPTFGSGEKVTIEFGCCAGADALALQPDGKIVLGGVSRRTGTADDFTLVRYNPDGSLDPAFGSGGIAITPFVGGNSEDAVHALVLQPDGKIVATGESAGDFALARYYPDGSFDASFGIGGKVTTDFGAGRSDVALGLAMKPDGKIVAVGNSFPSGGVSTALARYNADGSLDATFGTGGKVLSNLGDIFPDSLGAAVAVQPDGKIVIAGTTAGLAKFVVARYNADGTLDSTFSSGGKTITDFSGNGSDQAFGLALQPDGKIIVAGVANTNFALLRYLSNGTLDTSFGNGGKVSTEFGGYDQISGLALQPDGKIVVAGSSGPVGTPDFALARYNADGSLDPTFGTGGKLTTDFGAGVTDAAHGIALQPDGKLVVAGGYRVGCGGGGFALARYRGDPTLYLRLTPNQTTFSPGDPLEIDTAEANSGPDTMIDRYLGAALPPEVGPAFGCPARDAVVFVTETLGLVLTCLSAPPQTFPPFARNVLIPADLPLTLTDNVFQTMWPVGAPGGTYVLFMADLHSGTVADGSLDFGDLLAVGTAAVVSATQ